MRPRAEPAIVNIKYEELEERFGSENARNILRSMERLTGICEELVACWSYEDRLSNVLEVMQDSPCSSTRH